MAGESPSWDAFPLDDLTEQQTPITYGVVKPGEEGEVPFVRGGDIAGGRVLMNQLRTIGRDVSQQYRRTLLRGGEILVSLVGNPGQIAIAPPSLAGANIARQVGLIRLKPGIDTRYVSYFLQSHDGQKALGAQSLGSVQQVINLRDLKTVKLPLPPLPIQQRIAQILGSLDDKIELNRRMNATLEAMARALFQSWFIDFDPVRQNMDRQTGGRNQPSTRPAGHPSPSGRRARDEGAAGLPASLDAATVALFPDRFQESAMGLIPKGWTAQRLPDAIEVNPRRTLRAGSIAPYLDMKNLPTQGHSADEVIDREFTSGTKFQNGDTLLARITPCLENGKTGYVDFLVVGQIGWGSTEYIVLAPKQPLPPQFGYLLARSDALRSHAIHNMTGTSGRQRVPAECFNTFWLAVPPPDIARRFDELTAPLMSRIKDNADQSRTLATLRDTLLPKLLSGELQTDSPKGTI